MKEKGEKSRFQKQIQLHLVLIKVGPCICCNTNYYMYLQNIVD